MASDYHLIVKKSLDQNKSHCPLPEYIRRGWKRMYTPEEKEFFNRSVIIGPDVQIPNSIVRHRLGTTETFLKTNQEILDKALELPDELFMNLSIEPKHTDIIEDEKLSFQWSNDEDDDNIDTKRKKSLIGTIINKQREKRRKNKVYKYDYDHIEPLSIDEIIEEIRINIGKDLKTDEIRLIKELMQIISQHKNEQIINIYDELINIHLIDKFGGVPKLVQILQDIQRVFEQIAMKTNIASIETVINILLEKDNTYRVAVQLLNSFNENTRKNKQQQKFNLNDISGEISDYDQTIFNILIKDRISRLPASNLTMLINDLETIRTIDINKIGHNRDDQVKFISEQLNLIFTRAHLDGIKTAFNSMNSPISISLREFIDKIENSLKLKLNEYDQVFIESYIHDQLTSLNDNDLKIIYERLAQQGVLKRLTNFNELNQSITMGLMKKIDTEGLDTVIENIKNAHLDNESINKLIQSLAHISHHIQKQSTVSIEQIQKQLDMAYFTESRNLNDTDIHELSRSVELYSIAHIPLSEKATKVEYSTFLEQLKTPFLRLCTQRIINLLNQDNTIDLDKVSSKFYHERIIDLFNELIHGSDEFNQDFVFHQIKEQLRKTKDLPDKLYRQMLKEKLILLDTKSKIDTDKKKISMIIDGINRILMNEKDRRKQEQLIDLFDRVNVSVPERIKQWYKSKSKTSNLRLSSVKDTIKQKTDIKTKSNTTNSTHSPIKKSERTVQKLPPQLPTSTVVTSSKRDDGRRKGSLIKSQRTVNEEKRHSKTLNSIKKIDQTSTHKEEKKLTKGHSRISIALKSRDHQKETLDPSPDQPTISPSTTIATAQLENEDTVIDHTLSPMVLLQSPEEPTQERSNEQFTIHQSQDTSTDVQVNTTEKTEELDEKHIEDIEMLQADLTTILSETTLDGKMRDNNILTFEMNHDVAPLLYHIPSPLLSTKEVNMNIISKTADFINDLPYEKTKAQRILAKTMATNIGHQQTEKEAITTSISSTILPVSNRETIPTSTEIENLTDESSTKAAPPPHRMTLNKSLKQTENIYITSLTKSLRNLFSESNYDTTKLRKIHEELISSGHISPLNEFYRSSNEALRITLEHCVTFDQLIKWTLLLLQTNNKPYLIDFGHDLYSIAIDLDLTLIERIDNTRCAMEIQDNLKHQLQTFTENDLREINSYINAAQLEKVVNISKKLNVNSKDRMIFDLQSLLLHLIQTYHTFESKYRPMQTYIREISETYKSRAVVDLARKIDDIEKDLSKNFAITLFGVSKRFNESRFIFIK